MKILVTLGATFEPIDAVRGIVNRSTGRTGAEIAEYLANEGAEVIALAGFRAIQPNNVSRLLSFETYIELEALLKSHLQSTPFDAVIHAAAVSDYHVASVETGEGLFSPNGGSKLCSHDTITLRLASNDKLLEKIKSFSSSNPMVVGFKLTVGASFEDAKAHVLTLSLNPSIDYVVQNDLNTITPFVHPFAIFKREQVVAEGNTVADLLKALYRLIEEKP